MIQVNIRVFNAKGRDKTKRHNDKTLILIGEAEAAKTQEKIIDLLLHKYLTAWDIEPNGRMQFKLSESIVGELSEELPLWADIKKLIEEDDHLQTVPLISAADLFEKLFTEELITRISRFAIHTKAYKEKLK